MVDTWEELDRQMSLSFNKINYDLTMSQISTSYKMMIYASLAGIVLLVFSLYVFEKFNIFIFAFGAGFLIYAIVIYKDIKKLKIELQKIMIEKMTL